MGAIKIDVSAVLGAGKQAQSAKSSVTVVTQNTQNIRKQLDQKILMRNGISNSFSSLDKQLKSVSQNIQKVQSFSDSSANKYYTTEQNICRDASHIPNASRVRSARVINRYSLSESNKKQQSYQEKQHRFKGELVHFCEKMFLGASDAVISKATDIYSNYKADYDNRGKTYVYWQRSTAIFSSAKAIVKIGGGMALLLGGEIPQGTITLLSGLNDIINSSCDVYFSFNDMYDEMGQYNWLKDGLDEKGAEFGKIVFDDENLSKKIGSILYTSVDVTTLLFSMDGMMKNFGKLNTSVTKESGISFLWGEIKAEDIASHKVKFSLDPDYFIRKMFNIDSTTTKSLIVDTAKKTHKTLKKAYKIGNKLFK